MRSRNQLTIAVMVHPPRLCRYARSRGCQARLHKGGGLERKMNTINGIGLHITAVGLVASGHLKVIGNSRSRVRHEQGYRGGRGLLEKAAQIAARGQVCGCLGLEAHSATRDAVIRSLHGQPGDRKTLHLVRNGRTIEQVVVVQRLL